MGFRWGSALAERGNFILERVPYPLTPARRRFAAACLPYYQKFFPELLEEIAGLAQGQNCGAEDLQTVLFGMYAMPPACRCSCFAAAGKGGVLLGRNSDFFTALEELNLNVIYRFSGAGYDFTGNTTAFLEMEDGVNQWGLAVGLTAVCPTVVRPGLNAGLLLRFFLEKCRNTSEVLQALSILPIASAQTFTVADRGGDIAVVECNAERIEILRPAESGPFVCAANSFHAPGMAPYRVPGIDDWRAEERYETMRRALMQAGGNMDVPAAQALLAGEEGFLCQYDRRSGHDTVWSVVYDLTAGAIYRTEGNPGRRKFCRDSRFDFSYPEPGQV